MAVTTEWTVPQTNRKVYSGLSGDSKPSDPVAGSVFFETNTLDVYHYDGSAWQLINVRGSSRVYGLARNMVLHSDTSSPVSYSATEVLGFICCTASTGTWTITPVGGSEVSSIPAGAFAAGGQYSIHASAITVGTGGTALLFIPDA